MNLVLLIPYFFYLVASVLVLECCVFYMHGAQWNAPKRGLFQLTYPLLALTERYPVLCLGKRNLRGLVLAIVLGGAGYGVVLLLILLTHPVQG